MKLVFKLTVSLLLLMNAASASEVSAVVDQLLQTRAQQQLAPVISVKLGDKLNEELAYKLQTLVNRQLLNGQSPTGFKAGLTTSASQKKFKVDGPVAGVLIKAPLIASDKPVVKLSEYHRMMLEMELGFRLKQTISSPIASVQQLKTLVAYVQPVIEIPDLGFDSPKQLQGVDIIANNVIAKYFIVGDKHPASQHYINRLGVRLAHNETEILTANSGEVMNNQWQALLWLINKMVANGWSIGPDHVLITGAIGRMLPANPGVYQADFATLGRIEFSVKP